jgi:hypothetical protein
MRAARLGPDTTVRSGVMAHQGGEELLLRAGLAAVSWLIS